MTRQECEKVREWLPDYRWLNAVERQALDRHLLECPECREELREIHTVGEWFAKTRHAVPAGFADGVMGALQRETRSVRPPAGLVMVLVGVLAVEVLLAVAFDVTPRIWWETAKHVVGQLGQVWQGAWWDFKSLTASVPVWPVEVDLMVWGGACVVVAVFGWLTLQPRKAES